MTGSCLPDYKFVSRSISIFTGKEYGDWHSARSAASAATCGSRYDRCPSRIGRSNLRRREYVLDVSPVVENYPSAVRLGSGKKEKQLTTGPKTPTHQSPSAEKGDHGLL